MNDGYSFYPIVKILQLVHENIQMVHRDIKSDNIILTDIMVYVWLVDWLVFGIHECKEREEKIWWLNTLCLSKHSQSNQIKQ